MSATGSRGGLFAFDEREAAEVEGAAAPAPEKPTEPPGGTPVSDPKEVLSRILELWREEPRLHRARLPTRLAPFVADSFDHSNLAVTPRGRLDVISRPLLTSTTAKFIVYDEAIPYLATLVLEGDRLWKLKSFLFQCESCFGSGIDPDGGPCPTCGASGWGLAC